MLQRTLLIWLLTIPAAAASDEVLSSGCTVCHGNAQTPTSMPGFFHQSPQWIADRLRAFREGRLEGSVMPYIARGLSDAQIERLARHFSDSAQ